MDQDAQDQYVIARSRLWTPDLDKLLRKWKKQVGKKERGHRELARKYNRRHYMFGLPAVVLSTLITAGAFATFQECGECDDQQSSQCQVEVWVRLAIGILGIISIGLTSSVTFLNYQQLTDNIMLSHSTLFPILAHFCQFWKKVVHPVFAYLRA